MHELSIVSYVVRQVEGIARENGAFWVYRGGLYFDRRQIKEGEETEFYSLCRLDLETGETVELSALFMGRVHPITGQTSQHDGID